VETGVPDVRDIFEKPGPEVVNNDQLLNIRPQQKSITQVGSDEASPARNQYAFHCFVPRDLRLTNLFISIACNA
jgi:hypothetical protein